MHVGKTVQATVFGEVAHAQSTPLLRPVLLDPRDVIGANAAWFSTAGLRLGLGRMTARVGRYGAAAGTAGTAVHLTMQHEH